MNHLIDNSQELNLDSTLELKSNKKRGFGKALIIRLMILAILTVLFALHLSDLFMGNNSVEVYYDLKDKKADLKYEIQRLKNENAKLQKELFELKSLEPDISSEKEN